MSPLVREYVLFRNSHLFLSSPRARTDSSAEKLSDPSLARFWGMTVYSAVYSEDSEGERAYSARSFRALSIQPPL
jgi:hypothetical protein